MQDQYDATIITTSHVWLDRDGWHADTEMDEATERVEFTPTPRENLNAAIAHLRKYDICELGTDDHGHSQCWSVGTVVDAVEQMTAWIRENRGRLHKPTCMDGNGCRCGLGDLPMWGAAG